MLTNLPNQKLYFMIEYYNLSTLFVYLGISGIIILTKLPTQLVNYNGATWVIVLEIKTIATLIVLTLFRLDSVSSWIISISIVY